MTDQALALAFELACKGRDRAERRVKELEGTVKAVCDANQELKAANSALQLDNTQMYARLRIVGLMEEQAADRLGFTIPLGRTDDIGHSLKVVQ